MERRSVRQTGKNDGHITCLCNEGKSWSPIGTEEAILQIEGQTHEYIVPWATGETIVSVVEGPTGKYLRTDRDNTSANNLDELPDCGCDNK